MKSGQLTANQIWEFCYGYDYNNNNNNNNNNINNDYDHKADKLVAILHMYN